MSIMSTRRARAMAKGLCPQCMKYPIAPGKKMCEKCGRKSRERSAKRRAAEREAMRPRAQESIEDVLAKARAAGMSYGRYMAERMKEAGSEV